MIGGSRLVPGLGMLKSLEESGTGSGSHVKLSACEDRECCTVRLCCLALPVQSECDVVGRAVDDRREPRASSAAVDGRR